MRSNHDLKVAWCDFKAADFAVKHWHYSRRLPKSPGVFLGVWETGDFIGCIVFSMGANKNLYRPFGLIPSQGCELTRVALRAHSSPVSQVNAYAIKMVKKKYPRMRLIISFADPNQSHHGGIYQAGNWIYTGRSAPNREFFYKGRWVHQRSVTGKQFGRRCHVSKAQLNCLPVRIRDGKHRYIYPLDKKMRKFVECLRKPYPSAS